MSKAETPTFKCDGGACQSTCPLCETDAMNHTAALTSKGWTVHTIDGTECHYCPAHKDSYKPHTAEAVAGHAGHAVPPPDHAPTLTPAGEPTAMSTVPTPGAPQVPDPSTASITPTPPPPRPEPTPPVDGSVKPDEPPVLKAAREGKDTDEVEKFLGKEGKAHVDDTPASESASGKPQQKQAQASQPKPAAPAKDAGKDDHGKAKQKGK